MSIYTDFEGVSIGDIVVVQRGRGRDRIAKVYEVTPKQFKVWGCGKFWKKTGKEVGSSGSYYGSWASKADADDEDRIAREGRRNDNKNLFSVHRVADFSDSELETVAAIIRACMRRRNVEDEEYANKEAAEQAAGE